MSSIQDAVDIVVSMTEGRAKKLDLAKLAIREIQRICNRKRYWWRRSVFTFSSVIGTATYDLSSSSGANAGDFAEMIQLSRVDSGTSTPELSYVSDPALQQAMIEDTTQGDPSLWFIQPGTSQTVRLSAVPDAVKTYRGLYWATPNPSSVDPAQAIPLIPPQYHYVVDAALTRKVFFYLYGQNDPRYVSAERDFETCMAELDGFKGPATREAHEFRSGSTHDVVKATR